MEDIILFSEHYETESEEPTEFQLYLRNLKDNRPFYISEENGKKYLCLSPSYRREDIANFIQIAKFLSETYRIDAVITLSDDRVAAKFTVGYGDSLYKIKIIINLADDIILVRKDASQIVLTLILYSKKRFPISDET